MTTIDKSQIKRFAHIIFLWTIFLYLSMLSLSYLAAHPYFFQKSDEKQKYVFNWPALIACECRRISTSVISTHCVHRLKSEWPLRQIPGSQTQEEADDDTIDTLPLLGGVYMRPA